MNKIKFSNFENSELRDLISQNWDAKDFIYMSSLTDEDPKDTISLIESFLSPEDKLPEILKYFYLDYAYYLGLHPEGDIFMWVLHFSKLLDLKKSVPESLIKDYLRELRDNLELCQVQLLQSEYEFTITIHGSVYFTIQQNAIKLLTF